MSPTESQLRAALQEGAGRGVDADAIIARAERYRRARRQRITNIAAAAVVACVFVGGGTWFAVSHSDDEQAGSASGGAGLAPYASHAAPRTRATARAAPPQPAPSSRAAGFGTSGTATACPGNARRIAVPTATSTGSGTELFPGRASTITACGYVTDARVRHRAVLHGAVAQRVATTLDTGSTTPVDSDRSCPVGSNRGRRILLFAVGADGARAKPVQVTVRCTNVVATNGKVARYLPDLPDALSPLVR